MKNRVAQLFVGDGLNSAIYGTGAAQLGGGSVLDLPIYGPFSNLAQGDLMILNDSMTVVTAATVASITPKSKFYIVQGGTDRKRPVISQPLSANQVANVFHSNYSAETQQVSFIGFDGTDGNLVAANSTEYKLVIVLKDNMRYQDQRQTRRVLHYTTDATTAGTLLEIATAFVNLINEDEVLSQIMVAEIETDGTSYGIKITGLAVPFNKYNDYMSVAFEGSLVKNPDSSFSTTDWGTTSRTDNFRTPTAYDPGAGTFKQMYLLEDELVTYGESNKRLFPIIEPTRYISPTATYRQIIINLETENRENIEGVHGHPKSLIIAMNVASAGDSTDQADAATAGSFTNLLNTILGSSIAFV